MDLKHLISDTGPVSVLPWRTSMSSLEEFGYMSNSITPTPICSALMMGASLQSLLS
uniref:Uncharacterized protein n=1 Tax=Arundo donax TaxID=35708 RepID=A0A0A9D250_ARUDO